MTKTVIPETKHEHTWMWSETTLHDDIPQHCYHYYCKTRGCEATLGLNMTDSSKTHKEKC